MLFITHMIIRIITAKLMMTHNYYMASRLQANMSVIYCLILINILEYYHMYS